MDEAWLSCHTWEFSRQRSALSKIGGLAKQALLRLAQVVPDFALRAIAPVLPSMSSTYDELNPLVKQDTYMLGRLNSSVRAETNFSQPSTDIFSQPGTQALYILSMNRSSCKRNMPRSNQDVSLSFERRSFIYFD